MKNFICPAELLFIGKISLHICNACQFTFSTLPQPCFIANYPELLAVNLSNARPDLLENIAA
jgi:hypothetical protein